MPWEDLDCSTYSKSPETQQLTVIERWKEWLATVADGKLPVNQKRKKSLYGTGQTYRVQSSKLIATT